MKVDLLVLAFVIAAGFVAIPRAEVIGDWWHFLRYEPSEVVLRLAEDAGMSDKGKRLFYRFSPQSVDDSALREHCGGNVRHGCINGRSIYIRQYDIDNRYEQAVVTAAHEMLHVVYDRLSKEEKDALINKINQQLQKSGGQAVQRKLSSYPPLEYYNEAHSFIGSEVSRLATELESHYAPYFSDRSRSVKAYNSAYRGD
jgi:hypothetical protein